MRFIELQKNCSFIFFFLNLLQGFNGSMRLLDLRGMRNVHQVSSALPTFETRLVTCCVSISSSRTLCQDHSLKRVVHRIDFFTKQWAVTKKLCRYYFTTAGLDRVRAATFCQTLCSAGFMCGELGCVCCGECVVGGVFACDVLCFSSTHTHTHTHTNV